MTEEFDTRKELLDLREWWEQVHPSTKAQLLRIASGASDPVPEPPPSPSGSPGDDPSGVEETRERIEGLLRTARDAVDRAILLEIGLERRVGALIAAGRTFEDLTGALWRPLTMTKRAAKDLEESCRQLGTLLQELDWAIDPDPKFLPEHLERARMAGHKDHLAMIAEAKEMRKAWLASRRGEDDEK